MCNGVIIAHLAKEGWGGGGEGEGSYRGEMIVYFAP